MRVYRRQLTALQLVVACAGLAIIAAAQAPATAAFVPGARTVFAADFSSMTTLPAEFRFVRGTAEFGQQGGVRMLRASAPTEFVISLPEMLPQRFTLEADLVTHPFNCCADAEFGVEGTVELARSQRSAQLLWHHQYATIMGGGSAAGDRNVYPPSTQQLLGQLAHIQVAMDGTHFTLFTNDVLLLDIPDLQFARDRVLRVLVGGVAVPGGDVYLAKLRIGSGTLANLTRSPAATPPATPPSTSLTSSTTTIASPPVGAAGPQPVAAPATVGTPVQMSIDGQSFPVNLVSGGSVAGEVVSINVGDANKKSIGTLRFEPVVVDVAPGSPLDSWINSTLGGAAARKNGSIFSGFVPAGEQLSFRDLFMTDITFPTLDTSSSAAGRIRVTMSPEETIQTALASSAPASTGGGSGTRPAVWPVSAYRFSMDNLETNAVSRIESFSVTVVLTENPPGEVRVATRAPGRPVVPNLRLTINASSRAAVANWLAWFDSFVIKGNNGDNAEKTFTIDLLTAAGQSFKSIKGYGVGIVSMRALPPATGAATAIRYQVELYMERLEVVP